MQDRTPERLGPYRVLRRLGEGGMGVVYLAADAAEQSVAVKALHPGMAQEEHARRRLAREVETMRRVHSQYVAEVLGADLDGDPPYIVTRYVPGLTLESVVAAGGPLSGQPLARLGHGLAQALAAVHAAGVVHRDLKPGNVMIADGEPVVIDFGIAQLAETTRLTMTGMFMGTPGYLAPEVIEGKDSGPASDVHSWGATVAFAATGRPPFGSGAFEAIFFRIMHGQPDLDTLSAPLRPLVLRALSRDPAARPSAAELAQWVSSIDPGLLVPSPASAAGGGLAGGEAADGGPAVALGAMPRTAADEAGWQAWPSSTRPMSGSAEAADFRDLLPPVDYGASSGQRPPGAWPPGAGPPGAGLPGPGLAGAGLPGAGLPGGGNPAQPGQPGQPGQPYGGENWGAAADRTVGAVLPWSPLVIASIAMVVAISVMAPVIGTAVALTALVALRAAGSTSKQLARRRSARGNSSGLALTAVAFFPLAVLRSLVSLVLLAPVAALGFCMAAAATIILVPVHPLPQAVAFGAGALVAIIGLGPGSAGGRACLASIYTSVSRTPAQRAVAYVGVLAIAAWAATSAWSQSPAAVYWPVASLHSQLVHLPTLRTILTDVRQNLLRLARQFGL